MVNISDSLKLDNVVSNDKINPALITDLKNACDYIRRHIRTDFFAVITSAVSNHSKYVKGTNRLSRHGKGMAVDISRINGIGLGSNPKEFKELGDILVNTLVSMGYANKGSEYNIPKAILWQMKGHYNHIHISNTTNIPSEAPRFFAKDTTSVVDNATRIIPNQSMVPSTYNASGPVLEDISAIKGFMGKIL